MTLRSRTLSGVLWSSLARVGQQAITFAVTAVLAHLLAPSAFGTVAMAAVSLGFVRVISDFGLGAALVQHADADEVQKSTIFWYNIALGAVLSLLAILAAPLVASFFHDQRLVWLTRILALDFLISAFGVVPRSLLQKDLAFSALAKLDIGSALIAGLSAIWLAMAGLGIWALVAQAIISAAIGGFIAFRLSGWKPTFVSSWRSVRELLGFGAHLSGFTIVNYWARNADNILVGRVFGPGELGIYSRAYSLMLLPISQVSAVVTKVMFPTLSAIRDDKERVKRIYVRSIASIGFVCFPMMGGLLLVAEPFVGTVFGVNWLPMVPVVKILCFVGMLQCVSNPVGWVYTSQGKTDWMLRWGLCASAIAVGAIAVGVYLGSIEWVAWLYLGANVVTFYPCHAIAGRLIGLRVSEVVSALVGPAICTAVMMLAVWTSAFVLVRNMDYWLQLVVLIPLGVAVYIVAASLLRPTVYVELHHLAKEFWLTSRLARSRMA